MKLNPGLALNTSMAVLIGRLARIATVNIAGDGNCFFHSVSYQQTESRHAQIKALTIQHLINWAEHFIQSNTQQSCIQYLQHMHANGRNMGESYFYTGSCEHEEFENSYNRCH